VPPAEAAAPGRLITFEGGEGAGKSTQLVRLADWLVAASGREVVRTREPGGTPGAEALRALLVEGTADRWLPSTELLLFAAARDDHLRQLVRPALERGAWVLCDRFTDSTLVYQGAAGGVSANRIALLDRELREVRRALERAEAHRKNEEEDDGPVTGVGSASRPRRAAGSRPAGRRAQRPPRA